MSFHPRRILPPGASKKRTEGEAFYNPAPIPYKRATTNPNRNPNPSPNPSPSHSFLKPPVADFPSAPTQTKGKKSQDNPAIDSRLLAGYMAHEFLTRGTIVGQRFDPTRAEAVAVAVELKRKPVLAEQSQSQSQNKGKGKEKEEEEAKQHPSYADVASMLKTEGAHIPGVVNPSQLVKWLHQ